MPTTCGHRLTDPATGIVWQDTYTNRDGGHSLYGAGSGHSADLVDDFAPYPRGEIGIGEFPALQWVLGNASLASPRPGSYGYTETSFGQWDQWEALLDDNKLMVFPAHQDWDMDFPCWPWCILSLGSSGSDLGFVNFLDAVSGAFTPEVKLELLKRGWLARTMKYLHRLSNSTHIIASRIDVPAGIAVAQSLAVSDLRIINLSLVSCDRCVSRFSKSSNSSFQFSLADFTATMRHTITEAVPQGAAVVWRVLEGVPERVAFETTGTDTVIRVSSYPITGQAARLTVGAFAVVPGRAIESLPALVSFWKPYTGPTVNDANIISVLAPSIVGFDEEFDIVFQIQNTGTSIWPPDPIGTSGGFSLGSQEPADNDRWGTRRIAMPSTVLPGQTVTVTYRAKAHLAYGQYMCHWKMLQEGVAWFGNENGTFITVSPTAPPPNPQPPLAPTSLTATAGDGKVTLTWNPASTATSYNVYRGDSVGGEMLLQSGVTTTSFINTGLTNGHTYYYQVTAVNSSGESSRSGEVMATPAAVQPPTPVQTAHVRVTVGSDTFDGDVPKV